MFANDEGHIISKNIFTESVRGLFSEYELSKAAFSALCYDSIVISNPDDLFYQEYISLQMIFQGIRFYDGKCRLGSAV